MPVIVHQMRVGSMSTFCYFVGDPVTRMCAIIDPAFETDRILKKLRGIGFKATHLINTHGHPDHTAGNSAIVKATGVPVCIHSEDAGKLGKWVNSAMSRVLGGSGSPKPERLLADGDIIEVGKLNIKVIHTPGHTPGSICLHVRNHLFTGDTLFVGGVGRTDLPGGSHRQLLDSIRNRLYTLNKATVVWPGHDYADAGHSSIGAEKANNPFTSGR